MSGDFFFPVSIADAAPNTSTFLAPEVIGCFAALAQVRSVWMILSQNVFWPTYNIIFSIKKYASPPYVIAQDYHLIKKQMPFKRTPC